MSWFDRAYTPSMLCTDRPSPMLIFCVLAALTSLLTGCPSEDRLEFVRSAQARGDHAATLEPLRELLRESPTDREVNYLYGRALIATRSPELALFSLREAMNDPAWLRDAGLQLAIAGLLSGDLNETISATTQVLEAHPDDVDALLYRAQARAHSRLEPELALEDAERVLDLDPQRIEAYEPRILALLALGEADEASEALEEAGRRLVIIDAPRESLAWHCSTTAILAMDMGELERAAAQHERCLEQHPGARKVVEGAVHFFDTRQDFARSLAALRAANRAAPSDRSFRKVLAARLRALGEVDEATSLLRAVTRSERNGALAAAWIDLGDHHRAVGDYAAAATAFEQALAASTRPNPQLAFGHADALLLAGDLAAAETAAAGLSVEAHRVLIAARVAQERGQHAKALPGFLEAGRIWPDNPVARYYAAVSAEQLGEWDRALEEYRYSIRIDPGGTDARTRAAELLSAQHDFQRAYHLLFLKVDEFPLAGDGLVLGDYLIARISNPSQLKDHLSRHRRADPTSYPRGLVRAAEGLAERGRHRAAIELLRDAPGIDFASPDASEVLITFVRMAHAAEQPEDAEALLEATTASGPGRGSLQHARALHLELSGGPREEVEAAYRKAAELDPSDSGPLIDLARLSLARSPQRSLEWLDRARRLTPEDEEIDLARAGALHALERDDEAYALLEELLGRSPLSGEAAGRLAEMDLERQQVTARTADRAQRAARTRGERADYARLERVFRKLGDEARATAAAEALERFDRPPSPVGS